MSIVTARGPGGRSALTAVAAAIIAATAGCGTQAVSPATSVSNSPASAAGSVTVASPALEGPVSATFISESTGWALGLRPCHSTGCSWLALRKTTDGGRHWHAVPAPPTPWIFQSIPAQVPADAVSSVRFADAMDGWAFGPGLWATHDGGRTWHRVDLHGLSVQSLEAGDGWAVAVLIPCTTVNVRPGCGRFSAYATLVNADRWRPLPGASGTTASPPSLASSAGTGYISAGSLTPAGGTALLLAGPVSGLTRWHVLPSPCGEFWEGPLAAYVRTLVLGCAGQPGAGQQFKHAFLSRDGGRTWRLLTDPPTSGYLGAVSLTPAGTIFLSGGRSDVYISWDGGRTWHTSPSLNNAGLGEGLTAAMTTNTQGFALPNDTYTGQIWFTYDDGRTWTPVTLR